MKRIYFCILLIVNIVSFFFLKAYSLEKIRDTPVALNDINLYKIAIDDMKNSCGINSTFIVMHFLNKSLNYESLKGELVPEKDSKVSIADLERVLGEYEIKTHTLKLRPLQLYDNPNCLFIMYTPPPENSDIGHFSVVRVIDENNVQIIDPPYPPKILKKSDWGSNDKIIFTAVGDNFKPPSKFTQLNIASLIMIIGGISLLAYGKFSKCKPSK